MKHILNSDTGSLIGGEGDLHAFLCFHCLVDAGPPFAAFRPSGP